MVMYAIGIVPLIEQLQGNVRQVWFADDATGGGGLDNLRHWWDEITHLGTVLIMATFLMKRRHGSLQKRSIMKQPKNSFWIRRFK